MAKGLPRDRPTERSAGRGPIGVALVAAALLVGVPGDRTSAQISIDPVPIDPVLLEVDDAEVDLASPRALDRGRALLRVRIRNVGPFPMHVADVELLARTADGVEAGCVERLPSRWTHLRWWWRFLLARGPWSHGHGGGGAGAHLVDEAPTGCGEPAPGHAGLRWLDAGELRPRPIFVAPGRSAFVPFRWHAPPGGLAEGEPVLFFACATLVEADRDSGNDCDLELGAPRVSSPQLVIDDGFDEEASYWAWWQNGTGDHELASGVAAFTVTDESHAGEYSDAEINDYRRGPERGFPWGPGLRLELRARASDSNGVASDGGRGTRGFGFWNLGRGGPGAGDAMTNAWFISISPESLGFGVVAATIFDRGQPVLLQPLDVDLRQWHRYGIVWTPRGVTFAIDDRPVAASTVAPADPLGFVAWIDNYRLQFGPDGIATSFLDLEQDQSLFVDRVQIWSLGGRLDDPGSGSR